MTMKEWIRSNGPILIMAGALATSVPRLSAVFSAVEPEFLGMKIAWITGPGYGIASAACVLFSWHIYQERKALKLASWLLGGWLLLLVLMAIIQVPAIVATMRGEALVVLLPPPLDTVWATILAISSEMVVAITALGLALSKDKAKPPSPKQPESQPRRLHCQHCSYVAKSQAGLNAHQRKHKAKSEEI